MKLVKEIRSKEGVLHFRRFKVFSLPFFSIYVHHIFHEDQDKHEHTHPWNFISFVLSGCYIESSNDNTKTRSDCTNRLAFSSRYRPHKILKVVEPVRTLVITFGNRHPWFYKLGDERWVTNRVYRDLKRKGRL